MFNSLKVSVLGFCAAAVMLAAPLSQPSLAADGLQVAQLGQKVIANPGDVFLVCGNDNHGPGFNDLDANDACGRATFHNDNTFTLEYIGGLSNQYNLLGVLLQFGFVGGDPTDPIAQTSRNYFYVPGEEPIFTMYSYPSRGIRPVTKFYSGSGGGWNPGGVDAFYITKLVDIDTQQTATPEPSTGAIAGMTLAAGAGTILLRRRQQQRTLYKQS